MIVGTGVDIVSTHRVGELIRTYGDRFVARWFAPQEIAYCTGKAHPHIHFAARLAAKESTVKALRVRWQGPICWRDISVQNDDAGVPALLISESVFAAANIGEIAAVHLALSHCGEYAVASVVAEGPGPLYRTTGSHGLQSPIPVRPDAERGEDTR